ncbi:MAG: hypothetical protein RMJ17_02680 [Candidatus Aenigmarchaeota archaeon]|nr:hypothetical protein [Candidatus Aenigmarchaeota archaeon]MDW8149474.1 hypothetical protein [Candidatus Aenigmarchaeota archaeon]
MLNENLNERMMFLADVAQIASSRANNIKDFENVFIKITTLFYSIEDFFEVDDFDILSILGSVGQ